MLTTPICNTVQKKLGSCGNIVNCFGSNLWIPSAIIRQNAGFTSISHPSMEKPTCLWSAYPCSRTKRISETSIPHRQAWIPKRGIPQNTKQSRIKREMQLFLKVIVVFPRPFNTLPIVVARYKNGQSQARIVINVPASWFWKTFIPRSWPKTVKIPMQRIPT